MSGTFLVLSGERLTYKWFQRCLISYTYKNRVITDAHIHSAAQYCISIKDKDKNLSQVKNLKYQDITNTNNLQTNIKLEKKNSSEVEEKYNKFTSLRIHRNQESLIQKKVERLYPDPKNSLIGIYSIINHEFNDPKALNSNIKQIMINKSQYWESTFDITWPEAMSFKATAKTKAVAVKSAALKCLYWLEMNGNLKNGKPIMYDKMKIREIQNEPVKLNVTPKILNNMINVIETYHKEIEDIITQENALSVDSGTLYQHGTNHPVVRDPLHTDIDYRNRILKNRLLERGTSDVVDLPIFEYKDEILSKLENNQVLLIEGDTGCGKTTQVPQFIIDNFTSKGTATDCNILVSQPRRISAITLADRVAQERKEVVGDVVGFQVRLEQVIPVELGGILYCTTGILLKKMQSNPNLEGCSHVILDEAHERSIDTDMLMILLKRAIKNNPNLKVLIMSATINTHMFQQYFDCCTVKVPGRLYPVQMNFLEDIKRLPDIQKYHSHGYINYNEEINKFLVDYGKIVQIITWISNCKPPGAILCFLPGWDEITKVQSILENISFDLKSQLILPIHSKISHQEQRKIFEHISDGTRKIILATDIAETGITISDVVYVVDSAIRKELRWDHEKNLSCLSSRLVSKANIQQRKGRAGRIKPGESYHLITRAEYNKLESHPMPQILCNPLEKVILDSKTYTNEVAKKFLGSLLEPPDPITIQKSVNYLIELGVLDDKENLTALGKRMALFPIHPKFSKALVYSSVFNCIQPIVTIATVFSGEDNLFFGVLDHKSEIRENKILYHPSSDHVAIAWIFKQWYAHKIANPHVIPRFCKQIRLRQGRMETLSKVRDTFIQQLIQCRLLKKNTDYDDDLGKKSIYEKNDELVRALLYSATNQLISHKDIGFKNGILRKGVNELRTQDHAKAVISGESVNYKRKVWPSPYLTYFNGTHCEMRRSTIIRETSVISALTVLLFNQGIVQCYEKPDDIEEIVIYNNKKRTLTFSCNKDTADVLLEFRDIMWSIMQYSLKKQGFEYTDQTTKVFQYKNELLETLSEVLYMSSKQIEETGVKSQ